MREHADLDGVRFAGGGHAIGNEHAAGARAQQLPRHGRRGCAEEGALAGVLAKHAAEVVGLPPVPILVPGSARIPVNLSDLVHMQRQFCYL